MSQTETLLLILVGFSIAALIFLFLARILWHAGVRLGARRMRRQAPATVAELQSERDSLRGEYARLSQKLGSRLEQAKLQMAEQMAEVTRHRNRLSQMSLDLSARDTEIEQLRLRILALDEDVADRTAKLAEAENQLRAAREETMRADEEIEQLRRRVSVLEYSANSPAVIAMTDAGETPELSADERLKQRIEDLAALSQDIAAQRQASGQSEVTAALDPLLQEKLETVARETADLQQELARLDAAWAAKLGDTGRSGEGGTGSRPQAVANVISLAQRIRALQKDMSR